MRARLISNVTMQPLMRHLAPMHVESGEYGSLLFELADPASPAASAQVTHVLCVYDTDAMLGDAFYDPAAQSQADTFVAALDAFCALHPEKVVLANTMCAGTNRPQTFSDVVAEHSVAGRERTLNARLREIAEARKNLLLLDLELIVRRYGEDALVSAAFWYAGRVRYTNLMFRVLGERIRQALAAYASTARKVLVVDLDNTLWGGIVGETGPNGVTLSEDGTGACYRDFQRGLKSLKDSGVLLAIASKNNPGDVDEVFEKNTLMVLRRDDFAAIRANWKTKPENILDIAQALNLGLDSFVFIDDNPVEREIVAQSMPDVAIPGFPERVEHLPRWLVDDVARPYFGKYRVTSEDLSKTEQYSANEKRREFALHLDFDRFLDELKMVCTVKIDAPETVVRAGQMTQKTNQFNLTTMRCEIPEVAAYVENPDAALIVLDYADRFGAEGIVGLAMVDLAEARVANLLMSCRVIGRKIEDRLLAEAVELLRARGASKVLAAYIPTRKNEMVATFYEQHGFRLVSEEADGRKNYELSLV